MRKLFNKVLKKKKLVAVILFVAIVITTSAITVRFDKSYAKEKSYSCVATYQRWLNENYNMKLEADGVYGCNTAKATIKVIQKLYNKCYGTKLKVDGYWGDEMHEKIHKIKIKKGTCNEVVEMWQRVYNYVYNRDDRLPNISIDGCFGKETQNAIKKMGECNAMGSWFCTKACNESVIDSHRWEVAQCSCVTNFYGCAKTGSIY